MNTEPKKKKGRPSGSTSFTIVPLDTLRSLLGSKSKIVVSKKWLSNIELVAGDRREDIEEVQKALIDSSPPADKIEFALTKF